MAITLTLSYANMLARVKSRTHLKGSIDMTVKGAAELAHHEQAGDDNPSEFLLKSYMRTGVDRFKALVSNYLVAEMGASDVITDTLSGSTSTTFTITMNVSARFNTSLRQPLAYHASAYIENQMLFEWYQSFAPDVAKKFAAAAADIVPEIQYCFVKLAPVVTGLSPLDPPVAPSSPAPALDDDDDETNPGSHSSGTNNASPGDTHQPGSGELEPSTADTNP